MPAEIITKSSADVILDVNRTFGDESGTQITSSDVIRWINRFQLELVMRNPEVGAAVAVTNAVAGQADYGLLASVPTVLTIQSIHFLNKPIKHLTFQEAEDFIMSQSDVFKLSQGIPEFWYERGGIVTFYPAPSESSVGSIKFYFNKRPADITTDSQLLSVSDHYYNILVNFCLEQAYLLNEDAALAGAVSAKFEQGMLQMRERTQTQSDSYPFITQADDWT